MDFIFRAAEKFLKDHKRLMRYRKVFAVLAAVVVFATTYELILPAITIDRQRAADTPGMEVSVAAEETVEEEAAEESGDAEAEAQAEAEAKAQEEAEAAAAEEEARAAEEEAQEEKQSESEEADAAVNSSDAGTVESESDASQKTEETADAENGNSAQNDADADSDTAAAGEKTVAEEADDGSDNTDTANASADTAAADAAAAGTTAAAEQAIEYPVTLTYEGEDYTVTATFDETAGLPAGVSLDALEILPDMVYKDEDGNVLYDDYDVYFEKTVETIESDKHVDNTGVSSARFFDISFIDPEGSYAEPKAPVSVSVKYDDALSTEDTTGTVAVHFDDVKDKIEVVETKEEVNKDTIEEISFEGNKFSVYAIVGIRDNNGNEIAITEGESVNFTATVTENKASEFNWSVTENPDVIEITAQNNKEVTLRAKAEGSAKVTLSYQYKRNGNKYSNASKVYTVTVENQESSENLTLADSSVSVNVGENVSVGVTYSGDASKLSEISYSAEGIASAIVDTTDAEKIKLNITGVAAGTTTITVGDGNVSAAIDVTVEEASNPDYELENKENSGLTVKIKETGQVKKALSAYKLVVKPVNDSDDEYDALESAVEEDTGDSTFDFLEMYHIYFADKNDATDTEVPYDTVLETLGIGNMNLQVTLTYDTAPEGWPTGKSVKVGHYKINGSSVENAKVAASEDGADANIQNVKVNGNSVTLHIKSFSTIVLASSTNGSYHDYSGEGVSSTTSSSPIDPNAKKNIANKWQIVEGEYGAAWGQTEADGYKYSNDGLFRIQKNVVPAGNENEFYIFLNIEPTMQWNIRNYLKYATIWIANSASNKEYQSGDLTENSTASEVKSYFNGSGQIAKLCNTREEALENRNHTSTGTKHVTHINVTGTDISFDTDMYYEIAQNSPKSFTILVYVKKSDGTDTVLKISGISFADGTLTLPKSAYTTISETVVDAGDYSGMKTLSMPDIVEDNLGPYIEFQDSLQVTNGKADYSNNKITWSGFTEPAVSDVPSEYSDNNKTTNNQNDYYRKNVYQMIYKVRLKTENASYVSQSSTPTNGLTTMTDSAGNQTDFPIPEVKGTRYKVKIWKKDAVTGTLIDGRGDDNKSKRATFVLSKENGTIIGDSIATIDDDGYYTFDAELVGLDGKYLGTYYIAETNAPDGYIKTTEPIQLSIKNITTNRTGFEKSGNIYLYKSGNEDHVTVENTPINVAILKVDDSKPEKPLKSASFSLTNDTTGKVFSDTTDESGYIYFKNVPAGTYILTETAEPAGYKKTFERATITVNDNGSVTVSDVVDDKGNSVTGMVGADRTAQKQDSGENQRSYSVIKVVNQSSEVSLLLRKTGQDNNALSGATLSIKNNGSETLTEAQINAIISNGYSTISLMPGTEYVISESKAPAGYKKLEADITFKLVADETNTVGYKLTDGNGNELTDSMLSISKEGNTVVLRLKNDQGAVLPNAGGTGFLSPMTLCGIMAMAFALATAVMYGFSMRRGERRYK